MRIIVILQLLTCSFCLSAASIEYEIYEKASDRLIGSGTKEYGLADLSLVSHESGGRKVVEKYIELEQGYKVGARMFFGEAPLNGFGLLAKLTDRDFSWEWYDIVSPGIYKKRQGCKGKVSVRTSGLPLQEIPLEIQFLDDARLSFALGGAGNPETHDIVFKCHASY